MILNDDHERFHLQDPVGKRANQWASEVVELGGFRRDEGYAMFS